MPQLSARRLRSSALPVGLVLTAIAAVGTGAYWLGTQDPQQPAPQPPARAAASEPRPAGPGSPLQVCRATAATWFASDTTTDHSPAEARIRAAQRYGTDALQQRAGAGMSRAKNLGPRWQQWADHEAVIDTQLQPYIGEKPPAPRDGTAYAAVIVQRTATGADGWHQQLASMTVYCTLTRQPDGGPWRVDELQASLQGSGR